MDGRKPRVDGIIAKIIDSETSRKKRNPDRIDKILEKIGNLWKESPDLRFCQLIVNLVREKVNVLFFVEDDVLERFIDDAIERMAGKDIVTR